MTTDRDDIIQARKEFYREVNESFRKAERFIALDDVDEDDEDARADAYDERFHCEVCIVREVSGFMWDPVARYLTVLEEALDIPDDPVED